MAEFNRDKCAQRNRLAAQRDGVEASPFVLLAAVPAAQADGLRYAHGTLPATPEAALARINELLPADAPALTLDQIYLHYAEAANNNYIGARDSRPMFLGDTTLRNIATDATAGVAFMNSHRNGGLSHEADLPMGRTFAGRFEQAQDGRARALVGFYMVRGTAPNGSSGPTTDDLHAGIAAGTVFDVSVGLGGGEKVCDVCGNALDATRDEEDANGDRRRVRLCAHIPGTTHKMSKDEQTAQRARGVPKGTATYTLHHAHCGEVSAVYDGAVPGAGFTKALALARDLTPAERLQARAAYATLYRKGDFGMDEIQDAVAGGFERALLRLGLRQAPEPEAVALAHYVIGEQLTTLAPPLPDPRVAELETRLATKEAELATERAARDQEAQARYAREAATFAEKLLSAEQARLVPAQAPAFQALYARLLAQDAAGAAPLAFTTALGQPQTLSEADTLAAVLGTAPPHALFSERIPAGTPVQVLGAEPPGVPPARKTALLQKTDLGRSALKTQPPQKET